MNIPALLEELISEIRKNIFYCPYSGLLNGKMGIIILLYVYARFSGDKQALSCADELIDDLLRSLSSDKTIDFETGVSGIAWGLDYLLSEKYIEMDDKDFIFDTFDNLIFETKKTWAGTIDDLSMGIYIACRLRQDKSSSLWQKRAAGYLQKVKMGFDNRYVRNALSVYPASAFYPFYNCIGEWSDIPDLRLSGQEIAQGLDVFVDIAIREEKNKTDRVFMCGLRAAVTGDGGNKKENLSIYKSSDITLLEINKYYLYRLLYKRNDPLPDNYGLRLNDFINSPDLFEIRSLSSPLNIGLKNHQSGLAWSLLQYVKDSSF